MAPVDVRKTLAAGIAQLRTPRERRQFIADLRRLADDQERLVAALEQEQLRPPAVHFAPRHPSAGPGAPPDDFVRIERVQRAAPAGNAQDRDVERSALLRRALGVTRVRVMIGRELFYALHSPAYISLDLHDSVVRITPHTAKGARRSRLVVGEGMPRAWCDGARGVLKVLPGSRYAATIARGVLVVGAPLDPAQQPEALVTALEAAVRDLDAAWNDATLMAVRDQLSRVAQRLIDSDPTWDATAPLVGDAVLGARVQFARAQIAALTHWHADRVHQRRSRTT